MDSIELFLKLVKDFARDGKITTVERKLLEKKAIELGIDTGSMESIIEMELAECSNNIVTSISVEIKNEAFETPISSKENIPTINKDIPQYNLDTYGIQWILRESFFEGFGAQIINAEVTAIIVDFTEVTNIRIFPYFADGDDPEDYKLSLRELKRIFSNSKLPVPFSAEENSTVKLINIEKKKTFIKTSIAEYTISYGSNLKELLEYRKNLSELINICKEKFDDSVLRYDKSILEEWESELRRQEEEKEQHRREEKRRQEREEEEREDRRREARRREIEEEDKLRIRIESDKQREQDRIDREKERELNRRDEERKARQKEEEDRDLKETMDQYARDISQHRDVNRQNLESAEDELVKAESGYYGSGDIHTFSSAITRGGDIVNPDKIIIEADKIMWKKRSKYLIGGESMTILRDDIKSINLKVGIIGTDIIIGSYGSGIIHAENFTKSDAEKIKSLLGF